MSDKQSNLFEKFREPMKHEFDGKTYDHDRDGDRLNAQQRRVADVMKDGQWRTLQEISDLTGDPTASVSARLRDLRKERFGGHDVQRKYVSDGLWIYAVDPKGES